MPGTVYFGVRSCVMADLSSSCVSYVVARARMPRIGSGRHARGASDQDGGAGRGIAPSARAACTRLDAMARPVETDQS
ncbi:hypothetical protein STENM327S_01489 [Streptomyces tendae]